MASLDIAKLQQKRRTAKVRYGRARAEVKTNQMGYITVIARVARDLWQRKQTLSSGFALGLGSFTAINPWHPCNNYYKTMTAEARKLLV